MPEAVRKDAFDYPNRFLVAIIGQTHRKLSISLKSQDIAQTATSSGTINWDTLDTDPLLLSEQVSSTEYEPVWSVGTFEALPLGTESDTENPNNIDFEKYLDFFQTAKCESDFDVDVRLLPPPIRKERFRVKFKFIGQLPPRINFDPERD